MKIKINGIMRINEMAQKIAPHSRTRDHAHPRAQEEEENTALRGRLAWWSFFFIIICTSSVDVKRFPRRRGTRVC
jgi:hypothetical protein